MTSAHGVARWLGLAAALLLLNVALTFHNVWPTLAVRIARPPELSPELALLVLGLVAWGAWRARGVPRASVTALAVASVLLLVARYAEVTAPALYGRPVNLYWDARHVGNVVAMLAEVAGVGRTLLVGSGAVLATVLAFLAFRAAWSRIAVATERVSERRALGALAGVATAAWLAGIAGAPLLPQHVRFSVPVTATYAQQARLIAGAFLAARATAAPTLPAADARGAVGVPHVPGAHRARVAAEPRAFAALAGDDVLLVFLESYGTVTYTRGEFAARLESPRRALEDAVATTHRRVVSARLSAPTFGGNSWLSHLTLLTGTHVADPDTYARTMQVPRSTLVQEFASAGYQTIALMPGLRQAWPEGAFYGFDAILGADALDYRGPAFGWWRIPDQYALATLDRRPRDGRPRFVFFPTISSHAPFRPTPPYQPQWDRLAGDRPFDDDANAALALAPDWTNLAPAYGDTIAYAHEWLAGWLRRDAAASATVVVLGDHQPPAAVSGAGADWTVPVHVVTRRADVVNVLLAAGFVAGLQPSGAAPLPMHEVRAVLRAAFAGPPADGPALRSVDAAAGSAAPVGAGAEEAAGARGRQRGSAGQAIAPPRVHVSGGAGAVVGERGT